MKSTALTVSAALLSVCSCSRQEEQPAANTPAPTANPAIGAASENVVTEAAPENQLTPLAEPSGPIDPKSAEAAGQVVQHYGALIEQKRFVEARALWGDPNSATQFESTLQGYSQAHLEIGNPGEMEGAAGSIYITVPVILYGETRSNEPFKCSGAVTLRRVNDVPGSTTEQRRWHISKIDC
jgi:hypothetical protein